MDYKLVECQLFLALFKGPCWIPAGDDNAVNIGYMRN